MSENLESRRIMSLLVLNKCTEYHPFLLDYIYEFEDSFSEFFPKTRLNKGNFLLLKRWILRAFRHIYRYLLIENISFPDYMKQGERFSILCGNDFAYCIPSCFFSKKNYLYIFDHWPRANQVLVDWVKLFSIDKVFFSALQSTELFNEHFNSDKPRGVWIPEGINPKSYYAQIVEEKDIDVIEFGRRYDTYHERILPALNKMGYTHYFQLISGKINNPLSRSKISICFPSSITHPERSEHISTMTLRYLQSMISKCLIVGKMPYDMQFIFDYNPVIEVDEDNPDKQILNILNNYSDYLPLIEKNYETVMSHHLWTHRLELIRQHII
jgi:hypothetical protein